MVKRWIYSVLLLALTATGCNDAGQRPTDNSDEPKPTENTNVPRPTENTNVPRPTSADGTYHPLAVDDATFSSAVLASEQPVLVDFWAPWCGPCKQLTPIVEQVAAEYGGRVTVAKVNVDDAPDTTAQYDVTAIPTLVFLQDGRLVERIEGFQSKRRITQILDGMLAE